MHLRSGFQLKEVTQPRLTSEDTPETAEPWHHPPQQIFLQVAASWHSGEGPAWPLQLLEAQWAQAEYYPAARMSPGPCAVAWSSRVRRTGQEPLQTAGAWSVVSWPDIRATHELHPFVGSPCDVLPHAPLYLGARRGEHVLHILHEVNGSHRGGTMCARQPSPGTLRHPPREAVCPVPWEPLPRKGKPLCREIGLPEAQPHSPQVGTDCLRC